MKRTKELWGDAVGDAPWARLLAPAPGDLRIVQAFVNTADRAAGTDELTNPRSLADWLERWKLAPSGTKVGKKELKRAIEIRRAIRSLLQANVGRAVDRDLVAKLDQAVADATLRMRFEGFGASRVEPADGGFEGAIAQIVWNVLQSRLEGKWPRLKLCPNEDCGRVLYDTSPNRTRKWCSMKKCGNRLNARTFRKRNKRRQEILSRLLG